MEFTREEKSMILHNALEYPELNRIIKAQNQLSFNAK